MAQSGQLRGRVSEEQLIDLLNQASNLVETRHHKLTLIIFRWRKRKESQLRRNRPSWFAPFKFLMIAFGLTIYHKYHRRKGLDDDFDI